MLGIITAKAVASYLFNTSWGALFPPYRPRVADWYDARPQSFWNRWPEDVALGYYRWESPASVPSPFDPHVRLRDLVLRLAEFEEREPSDVLRQIEAIRRRGRE